MAAENSHCQRNNDVFLSFSGRDTRKNFTDHLYYALTDAGIHVFRDNEGLPRGEHISTQLKQAIQRSRISIIVLSRNYASSRWCLEELGEIMECKKSVKQMVLPVFYDVDPSDVRHQKKTFAYAFAEHEQSFAEQTDKVDAWRAALTEAANLSGYDLNGTANGFEGKLIREIVEDILKQLKKGDLLQSGAQELPLLTTELVGQAFKRNKEVIWSWLMDDGVLRVGIYGMGGVGKTTLMTHIQNRLLKEWSSSHQFVYWVTVSHDFSVYKLQNLIAEKVSLNLLNYEGERERAAKLSHTLAAKKKSVLIMDDLWHYFDVLRVGIPVSNRCKLVLTTRSQDICRRMHLKEENVIKVQPLSEEEAWNFFAMELESYSPEVEPLAKDVARECSGLPLGIRTMASSMRGVSDIREWRNALEELRGSKVRQGDMDEEVLCVLKLSYLRLNDSALQKCFLYCALFPENANIRRDELIELLIAEEILDEKKNKEAEFDSGHTMLNKLQNVCLLEGSYNSKTVKMHDLIRDMAIQQLRKSSTMVEAGLQLEELPDMRMWTENLVTVSLMRNNIVEIPSGQMPKCPNLSTLLLQENWSLIRIADSFFEQFQKLKVLDFSQCIHIEKLPDSIGNLVNLVALLLRGCVELKQVPCLAKLTELKMLDLSGCSLLSEIPEGVEMLSKLKYLDITDTSVKEIPKGLLPKLSRLQVLNLINIENPIRVEGREVGMLRKLETLECAFEHPADFNQYMKSREQPSLSKYYFRLCKYSVKDYSGENMLYFVLDYFVDKVLREGSKGVGISECRIGKGHDDDSVALPLDVQVLYIEQCHALKCLCEDIFELRFTTQLVHLWLKECDGIESLISTNSFSHDPFKSLQRLNLSMLRNLLGLVRTEDGAGTGAGAGAALTPFPSNSTLSNLRSIQIRTCDSMKKLFPPILLPYLHKLENILVVHCKKLEEIFATDEREGEGRIQSTSPTPFPSNHTFSSLKSIYIRNCDMLKKLFPPSLLPNLHNLETIQVYGCTQMEEIFAMEEGDDKEEEEGRNRSSSYPSSFLPNISFSLPKLSQLHLSQLRELRSICHGALTGQSLQEIALINCPKLKRIPFSLPQPSLELIKAYPEEWWESVEWDNANAKNHLQFLLVFTQEV